MKPKNMKLIITIPKEDYDRIHKYGEGATYYPMTIRLYKAVQKGKIADAQKYKDVKEHIMLLANDYKCYNNTLTRKEAIELCNMLETRAGHWLEEIKGTFGKFYRCSECNELYHTKTNYCPFCGCIMIEESEVDNDNLVNKNQGLVKDLVKESEVEQ